MVVDILNKYPELGDILIKNKADMVDRVFTKGYIFEYLENVLMVYVVK